MRHIYVEQTKGFRGFLKDVWLLWKERQLTRRALRILNAQDWSVEFLTSLLIRAASASKQQLEMTIVGPNGRMLKVNTLESRPQAVVDEDIFNHLDDDVKIRQFMEAVR
jgi:hypothetical protein